MVRGSAMAVNVVGHAAHVACAARSATRAQRFNTAALPVGGSWTRLLSSRLGQVRTEVVVLASTQQRRLHTPRQPRQCHNAGGAVAASASTAAPSRLLVLHGAARGPARGLHTAVGMRARRGGKVKRVGVEDADEVDDTDPELRDKVAKATLEVRARARVCVCARACTEHDH